jgi:hypothetical protein
MKSTLRATAAAVFILAAAAIIAPPAHAYADVSFDFFYSDLSPHGSWLVSAEYGRVWQPRVYTRGWNPYYDGHWQYADVGWVWVSDYDWGAVPYHYGTWVMDPRFGWVWVPGYTWAPAWVTFRTGPDYIGWAPVSPRFAIGVSLDFAAPSSSAFLFVSTRNFASPRIRPYVVNDYNRNTNVYINQTTIINNLRIQNNVINNRGPDVRLIERASGRRFRAEPIERVARVAPFQGVRRDQLTIAPERQGRMARASEPVSAQRPLPDRTTVQRNLTVRERQEQLRQERQDRSQTQPRTVPQSQERQQPMRQDAEQQRRDARPPQARRESRPQQVEPERPHQQTVRERQLQIQRERQEQLDRERSQPGPQPEADRQPPSPRQQRAEPQPKAQPKKKQPKKNDKDGGNPNA